MIIIMITIMTILVIMSTMNLILTKIMTNFLFVIRIIIIIYGNFLFIKIFIDLILNWKNHFYIFHNHIFIIII